VLGIFRPDPPANRLLVVVRLTFVDIHPAAVVAPRRTFLVEAA
jgi:hypothetical protein